MAPKRKIGLRDDLTIDGTAKLGGGQEYQQPRARACRQPAKKRRGAQPYPSHTTPIIPYAQPFALLPQPVPAPWLRPILDQRSGCYMSLYQIVKEDRHLPKKGFFGPSVAPRLTFPIPENRWCCQALHKRVPWDLCLAACSVARRPCPGPVPFMQLVAEELKVVHVRALIVRRRLKQWTGLCRDAKLFMNFSRTAFERQAAVSAAPEPETLAAVVEGSGSVYSAAMSDATISDRDDNDDEVGPTTPPVSKRKAPAEPRIQRSGVSRSSRNSRAASNPATISESSSRTRAAPTKKSSGPKDPSSPKHLFRQGDGWTREEEDKICLLHMDMKVAGLTWKRIGDILGRSESCRQRVFKGKPENGKEVGKSLGDRYEAGELKRMPRWTMEDTKAVYDQRQTGNVVGWDVIGAGLNPQRTALECQMQYRQYLILNGREMGIALSVNIKGRLNRDGFVYPSQKSVHAAVGHDRSTGSKMSTPSIVESEATEDMDDADVERGQAWVTRPMRLSLDSL